mmetsp:Transcript_21297/g.40075  ORF Transcript_21297/g.40075 Transcript_21297/m.40075 type:complete len:95 (-) Transcript_21297:114-398(-)
MTQAEPICVQCFVIFFAIPFVILVIWVTPWVTSPAPMMGLILPLLGCTVGAALYGLPLLAIAARGRVHPMAVPGYIRQEPVKSVDHLELESASS